MAMIALAAQLALEVGSVVYSMLNRPQQNQAGPVIGQISTSANGAPIPFGYGTNRIPGQIIWSGGITFKKHNVSEGGIFGIGGATVTYYSYFCSFAAAFGEGPMCLKRVWADTKIIYIAPGITSSEYPAEDFPAWSSSALYNPGNIVSYQGQVYQALIANTNVTPGTATVTTWQLISDYQPWSSTIQYNAGDVVAYPNIGGAIYVAQASNLNINPTSGNTTTVNGQTVPYWVPLAKAYPQPTIYPGDELQLPDPTIQADETASYTPGYRGVGYAVWENFPLLNFGNRLPNIRGEVQYMKVRNIL